MNRALLTLVCAWTLAACSSETSSSVTDGAAADSPPEATASDRTNPNDVSLDAGDSAVADAVVANDSADAPTDTATDRPPDGTADATTDLGVDAAAPDGAADVATDVTAADALDATPDAALDAVSDAVSDAGAEAAVDAATLDAAADATADVASDARADVAMESAVDASTDATADVTSDAPTTARSCLSLRSDDATLPDGVYMLDLDGDGPGPARSYYCDMAGGGWTLVARQVPSELLPDVITTVAPERFGELTHSYRLGNPEITAIRPSLAWRLTDNTSAVYVSPRCVVDWTRDYIDVMMPTDCTQGYTTTGLTTLVNGRWTYCSARGIGINNNGAPCSIRMNESGSGRGVGAMPNGRAYGCAYTTADTVSLWFQ